MLFSRYRSHAGSWCGVPDDHARRTEETEGGARGFQAPCPPLLQPIGGLGWAHAGRQPMTRDVFVSSALQFEEDYRSLPEENPEDVIAECTSGKSSLTILF